MNVTAQQVLQRFFGAMLEGSAQYVSRLLTQGVLQGRLSPVGSRGGGKGETLTATLDKCLSTGLVSCNDNNAVNTTVLCAVIDV